MVIRTGMATSIFEVVVRHALEARKSEGVGEAEAVLGWRKCIDGNTEKKKGGKHKY